MSQSGGGETQVAQMEQQLYTAVSSTSSWLDGVENNVFSASVLIAENADTQLHKQEVIGVICAASALKPQVTLRNEISTCTMEYGAEVVK